MFKHVKCYEKHSHWITSKQHNQQNNCYMTELIIYKKKKGEAIHVEF